MVSGAQRSMVGLAAAAAVLLLYWTIIAPALDCSAKGGLPVAGIGRIVCAEKFDGRPRPARGTRVGGGDSESQQD